MAINDDDIANLANALERVVAAMVTGRAAPSAELIPHTNWETPASFETERDRRARCRWWARAARDGKIEGARQVRRRWFASPAAVAAFIVQHGERPSPKAVPEPTALPSRAAGSPIDIFDYAARGGRRRRAKGAA